MSGQIWACIIRYKTKKDVEIRGPYSTMTEADAAMEAILPNRDGVKDAFVVHATKRYTIFRTTQEENLP